jgi:hypothetical protein
MSLSTLAVATDIVNSPEHFANFVTSEYFQYLRRAPDATGLAIFTNAMTAGLAPEVVEALFVSSNEYILNHGNDVTLWLTGLYNDLLGRAPDQAGFNHWLGALAGGQSPFLVALQFSTSVERETMVITQDYNLFLNRAPDASGLNTYLSLMRQGNTRATIASDILGSTEFFQLHGANNSDFVTALYVDELQRAPSSTELAFWVDQLPTTSPTPTPGGTTTTPTGSTTPQPPLR